MSNISLIAAVDNQSGLGKNNQLLCHLPADLRHFKSNTLGKPVIMGRNTFASIGRPLPGRQNIVLSTQLDAIEGVQIAANVEDALRFAGDAAEIMIIGGAAIYQQMLARANTIYLTVIDHRFEADVYFPQLDAGQWQCIGDEFRAKDENNAYDISFRQYQRIA